MLAFDGGSCKPGNLLEVVDVTLANTKNFWEQLTEKIKVAEETKNWKDIDQLLLAYFNDPKLFLEEESEMAHLTTDVSKYTDVASKETKGRKKTDVSMNIWPSLERFFVPGEEMELWKVPRIFTVEMIRWILMWDNPHEQESPRRAWQTNWFISGLPWPENYLPDEPHSGKLRIFYMRDDRRPPWPRNQLPPHLYEWMFVADFNDHHVQEFIESHMTGDKVYNDVQGKASLLRPYLVDPANHVKYTEEFIKFFAGGRDKIARGRDKMTLGITQEFEVHEQWISEQNHKFEHFCNLQQREYGTVTNPTLKPYYLLNQKEFQVMTDTFSLKLFPPLFWDFYSTQLESQMLQTIFPYSVPSSVFSGEIVTFNETKGIIPEPYLKLYHQLSSEQPHIRTISQLISAVFPVNKQPEFTRKYHRFVFYVLSNYWKTVQRIRRYDARRTLEWSEVKEHETAEAPLPYIGLPNVMNPYTTPAYDKTVQTIKAFGDAMVYNKVPQTKREWGWHLQTQLRIQRETIKSLEEKLRQTTPSGQLQDELERERRSNEASRKRLEELEDELENLKQTKQTPSGEFVSDEELKELQDAVNELRAALEEKDAMYQQLSQMKIEVAGHQVIGGATNMVQFANRLLHAYQEIYAVVTKISPSPNSEEIENLAREVEVLKQHLRAEELKQHLRAELANSKLSDVTNDMKAQVVGAIAVMNDINTKVRVHLANIGEIASPQDIENLKQQVATLHEILNRLNSNRVDLLRMSRPNVVLMKAMMYNQCKPLNIATYGLFASRNLEATRILLAGNRYDALVSWWIKEDSFALPPLEIPTPMLNAIFEQLGVQDIHGVLNTDRELAIMMNFYGNQQECFYEQVTEVVIQRIIGTLGLATENLHPELLLSDYKDSALALVRGSAADRFANAIESQFSGDSYSTIRDMVTQAYSFEQGVVIPLSDFTFAQVEQVLWPAVSNFVVNTLIDPRQAVGIVWMVKTFLHQLPIIANRLFESNDSLFQGIISGKFRDNVNGLKAWREFDFGVLDQTLLGWMPVHNLEAYFVLKNGFMDSAFFRRLFAWLAFIVIYDHKFLNRLDERLALENMFNDMLDLFFGLAYSTNHINHILTCLYYYILPLEQRLGMPEMLKAVHLPDDFYQLLRGGSQNDVMRLYQADFNARSLAIVDALSTQDALGDVVNVLITEHNVHPQELSDIIPRLEGVQSVPRQLTQEAPRQLTQEAQAYVRRAASELLDLYDQWNQWKKLEARLSAPSERLMIHN
jgi:hypothetical protein